MKLELTLPERPGLLHAIPALNLVMVLWLVTQVGPVAVQSSGVSVSLPPTAFQLERYREHLVVTLAVSERGGVLYLGRDEVTESEFASRLDAIAAEGGVGRTVVVMRSDLGVAVGVERRVAELVLARGFQLVMAGAEGTPASGKSTEK